MNSWSVHEWLLAVGGYAGLVALTGGLAVRWASRRPWPRWRVDYGPVTQPHVEPPIRFRPSLHWRRSTAVEAADRDGHPATRVTDRWHDRVVHPQRLTGAVTRDGDTVTFWSPGVDPDDYDGFVPAEETR